MVLKYIYNVPCVITYVALEMKIRRPGFKFRIALGIYRIYKRMEKMGHMFH